MQLVELKGFFLPSPYLIFMYTTPNFSKKTYSEQQGIKNKLLRAPVRNVSCEIMEEKEPAAVTVLLGEKPFHNETQG